MSRRHHRTVVKRVHPWQTKIRMLVLLTTAVLLAGGGFWLGHERGSYRTVPLTSEADNLRHRVSRLETQLQVDQQTLDVLREELADSRASIDELERELEFYRQVMAPEETGQDVLLRHPVLRRAAGPDQWSYQLVAQQGGARDKAVHKGTLYATLWGHINGTPQGYPLVELDDAVSADSFTLNFRYFQRLDGVLQLPPGFDPERLELRMELTRPSTTTVEMSFLWRDAVAEEPFYDAER